MIQELKQLDLNNMTAHLVAVKKSLRRGEGQYSVKYVESDDAVINFLKGNAVRQIQSCNSITDFTFDTTQPEEDEMLSISSDETEFDRILEAIEDSNPEEDRATVVEDLFKTTFYLTTFRDENQNLVLVGIKRIPETWNLKKKNDTMRRIFFREERFHDLTEEHVFSLARNFDAFYFDESLLVLSKRNFEIALNFREGMKNKANQLYESLEEVNFIKNIDFLKEKCGENIRYLKKLSTIYNLGLYREDEFQQRVIEVSEQDDWDIEFEENRIVINDANFESVLYILENKRLFSKLTMETKDVDGKAETPTFAQG